MSLFYKSLLNFLEIIVVNFIFGKIRDWVVVNIFFVMIILFKFWMVFCNSWFNGLSIFKGKIKFGFVGGKLGIFLIILYEIVIIFI